MTFELMEHMQRFVESLTNEEWRVFKWRNGFYFRAFYTIKEVSRRCLRSPSTIRKREAIAAAKFDEHVLKPFLESQGKETDGHH